MSRSLTVTPVVVPDEIRPGDDLAALIAAQVELEDADVLVVAQKAVSKAEGALLTLPAGADSRSARRRLAAEQASRIVVDTPEVLIVETSHGFVCANAGIDASNVADGSLVLLPDDPDDSARRLRAALAERTGATVAVIISDTFGRPWRTGQTDVAIGVAGLAPLRDERGSVDRHGQRLDVTEAAVADELAGAADLVRSKADGALAVVVRGFAHPLGEDSGARTLVRPPEQDLFRRGRGALTEALGRSLGQGTMPLGRAAIERALDAARRVGGDAVELDVRDDGRRVVVSAVEGPSDALRDAPVLAGAAAMALVAAVLDLDGHATLRAPAPGEPGAAVVEIAP